MDFGKEKEILWGILILIIIVAAIFLLMYLFNGEVSLKDEADITVEDPEENAADFPEEFPLEAGVSFAESFKYVPVDSNQQQSTLSYSSNLSLEENIEIFEKFLADNEFNIINQVNEENMAFYYGEKNGNSFSLILEDKDGEVLVSASYLDIEL
jgi:hypothetical protein